MKKCNLICNLESGKGIKKKDIDFIIKLIESYDYKVINFIERNKNYGTRD